MPVTQDDVDANPELAVFVMRQTSELMTQTLRKLAVAVANYPHVTAEQALTDAALMFECTLEQMISRFGSQFSRSQH